MLGRFFSNKKYSSKYQLSSFMSQNLVKNFIRKLFKVIRNSNFLEKDVHSSIFLFHQTFCMVHKSGS